jgi:hypothetical protein
MPGRPATTGSAAHRARQAQYRERLRERRDPEADDVKRHVFAVLRDITFEARQGRLSENDQYQKDVRILLLELYSQSLARLESAGFSRRQAKRRLSLALTPPYPVPKTVTD